MHKALRAVVALPGVAFVGIGIGWFLVPGLIAPQLGMEVLESVALSSQIGDLGSFFLTLGTCILLALGTNRRAWLYPALMLLGFAASGRVLAWLFHDAAFAWEMLAVEVPVIALLFVASTQMAEPRSNG